MSTRKEQSEPLAQLEARVSALEEELAALKETLKSGQQPRDWRWMLEFGKQHPGLHEVFEEGMKLREKDRAAARKRFARSRKAKS
jgi:hypothetical protein